MNQDKIVDELFTLRDYLRFGLSCFRKAGIFYGHGTDNAWDEALALIIHALHLPMDMDKEVLDARLTRDERLAVLDLFAQRIEKRVPVPYLTQQAWFCGLEFFVDERVLIPRSPINEMIQAGFKPWYQGDYPERILDLCTGSGCIGIACAYAFDEADIVLADLSNEALEVAAKNIEKHDLQDQVQTCQSDLFADIEGPFDLIVSNPPYVDVEDFSLMPDEYQHEPDMALVSGQLGLQHPLQILQQGKDYLTDDGILVLELGNSGRHLEALLPDVDFNWVEFDGGGHGVLVISKVELEMIDEQLQSVSSF
ncbi:MAG: 50S ribosomal protein L3 N(5)-glutamine methyltransferase [Pseudomonadales bacterium]|nr:50S ribosomal protein L3 N(5)-glutamine methyltransferase [Pseudomonadales bacterium]